MVRDMKQTHSVGSQVTPAAVRSSSRIMEKEEGRSDLKDSRRDLTTSPAQQVFRKKKREVYEEEEEERLPVNRILQRLIAGRNTTMNTVGKEHDDSVDEGYDTNVGRRTGGESGEMERM